MKCAFLYNPKSGKGKIGRKIEGIGRRLREIFGEVTIEAPKSAEEMTARASFWARRAEALVFAGGDGTFHAVLRGVVGTGVALGYIPAGTCNDAAGNLGIPKNVRGALNVIARGRTARIDCMRLNGEDYALSIAAAGSLTRVTYETAQSKKKRLGWLAYALGAWRRLWRAEGFYAEAAGGGARIEGNFALAFVLNGKKLARFSAGRGASMRDGVCEAAFIRREGASLREKWGTAVALGRVLLFGMKRGGRRVATLRGARMTVRTAEGVVWDFDGERGTGGDLDVEVVRGAVKVFCPR